MVSEGVKVRRNPATGKLEGLPEEWKNYNVALDVDESKMVSYKKMPEHIRPSTELPDKILEMINQPIISRPMNVKHEIHMELDVNSAFGVKGIPEEWRVLFEKESKLEELSKDNPKILLDIVSNFENKVEHKNRLVSKEEFHEKMLEIKIEEADPSKKYQFEGELGKGAMCKVYKCSLRTDRKQVFACRIMKMSADPCLLDKVKVEIAVMEMCKHRAIVHYEESFIYKNCLFMLVEFMDGGCLTEVIYEYPKAIPEPVIAYISREIFLALAELHQNYQIHRDLKSDNILVKQDGSVKVADFGFATQLTKEKSWRKSQVGTPAWMAPELISKRDYNEKVDIWSGGMIVYELAETEPPFLRFPPNTSMYLICQRDAPRLPADRYSPAFCDFIQRCMEKEPSKRWTAAQLLKHEFLAQAAKDGDRLQKELARMVGAKKKA